MSLSTFGALLEAHSEPRATKSGSPAPAIMVVDDDAGVLSALEANLAEEYRVVPCASASAAVDAMNEDICVVVLDIKMKDHDGFWACDEIRKKNTHVPIIFYSAYQDLKQPMAIINEHQPFGYVTKGTEPGVLMELIGRATRYFKVITDARKVVDDLQRIQSSMQKLKTNAAR